MDETIAIILGNVPFFLFKVKDLVSLGATCKYCYQVTQEQLGYLSLSYANLEWPKGLKLYADKLKNFRCDKCSDRNRVSYNPFVQELRCDKCFGNLVTMTTARKYYKLKDTDLLNLDYMHKWSSTYRLNMTLFWENDVKGLAMLKHKYVNFKDLKAFLEAPRPESKSRQKRYEQLERVISEFDSDTQKLVSSFKFIQQFLRNGEYGIREIKSLLNPLPDILDYWNKLGKKPYKSFEYYILLGKNKNCNIKDSIKKDLFEEEERERTKRLQSIMQNKKRVELKKALESEGITFRADSKLCASYIEGTTSKTITDIVQETKKMEFLHTYTNYHNYKRIAMVHAYDNARFIVSNLHGYIEDEYEYSEVLEQYIDDESISKDCQRRALEDLAERDPDFQVPDYMLMPPA